MPVSALLPLLLIAPQTKPTFDQVEALKHKAYRALKDYREVIDIVVSGKAEQGAIRLSQRIAGPKQRLVAQVGGAKYLEAGHDGQNGWMISYPAKQYVLKSGRNELFYDRYEKPKYSKLSSDDPKPRTVEEGARKGDFNFVFDNGYNIRFVSNPPLKIVSDETALLEGAKTRKIVARAVIQAGKRYVEVTQWFYADKWIMRMFKVEGMGKEGGPFSVAGVVAESSFAAGSKDSLFRLDPKLVKGFTKK